MNCQICGQASATVHITEIPSGHFAPKPDGEVAGEVTGDDPPPTVDGPSPTADGPSPTADRPPPMVDRHICEACAQNLNLPQMQVVPKAVVNIWKLLQQSAKKARRQKDELTCPECGMTLTEFRGKGKLGCPKDYEIFREDLTPLLQRIHNATRHIGRIPGLDPEDLERMNRLTDLRSKLEGAIRGEEYEKAARFRDEIAQIEAPDEKIGTEE
jgi:protein arginine kinase activator